MRSLRWSLWLFGMCLAGTVQADPTPRAEPGNPPPITMRELRASEAPGGLRMLFATSNAATRVGLCLGFVVQSSTRDWTQQASAVLDLEVRREHLVSLVQAHPATGVLAWRSLDAIRGDTAVMCMSLPSDALQEGLNSVLDGLRPVTLNFATMQRLVALWQNHQGLAQFNGAGSIYQQAHALAWLGNPEATGSIASSLEQLSLRNFNQWRPVATSHQPLAVIAVAGQLDVANAESTIRSNRWVRLRQRSIRALNVLSTRSPNRPEHSYPRFARAPNAGRPYSNWIFSWPVAPLVERHALALQAIAWLIEQRLSRTFVPQDDVIASCGIEPGRGFGTLQIEIRSNRPLDLAFIEQRVFATLDQLRDAPVSLSELQTMNSSSVGPSMVSGDFMLDQALHLAQKALFSWNVRAATSMTDSHLTPAEIQQWVKRDLSLNNASEVVSEAVTPRPASSGANRSALTGTSLSSQREKLRPYTVKPGESLQSIAQKFQVTIPELVRVNRLHHPNQISPGSRLFVPVTSRPIPTH